MTDWDDQTKVEKSPFVRLEEALLAQIRALEGSRIPQADIDLYVAACSVPGDKAGIARVCGECNAHVEKVIEPLRKELAWVRAKMNG